MGYWAWMHHWTAWVKWYVRPSSRLAKANWSHKVACAFGKSGQTWQWYPFIWLSVSYWGRLGHRCLYFGCQFPVTLYRPWRNFEKAKSCSCIYAVLKGAVTSSCYLFFIHVYLVHLSVYAGKVPFFPLRKKESKFHYWLIFTSFYQKVRPWVSRILIA